MNTVIVVLSSLQLISIYFVWLLIKNYFSKYVDKKAENLATKEDIGEITRITEEVRSVYVHEVERLRNDLIILREEITSVRVRGDESLMQFFENCSAFSTKFDAFPIHVALKDGLDNFCCSVEHVYTNIKLSQMHLLAYFHGNDNIVQKSKDVTAAAAELLNTFNIYFDLLAEALINQRSDAFISGMERGIYEYKKAIKAPSEKFGVEFSKYSAELSAYFKSKYQSD